MSNSTPESTEDSSSSRRIAFVAVLLILVGATMLFVGTTLAWGVPIGLVVLGGLFVVSGVLLGYQ